MNVEFDESWKQWIDGLAVVERHAATPEERARVMQVRRAIENADVIGALCHDVKDPLAAIVMGATLAKKQGPSSRALDAILHGAKRLDRIVTNVRDLELLRAGGFVAQLRVLPMTSVLAPHVQRQRDAALLRTIKLELTGDEVRATADPNATARIVDELLDNAIGFSPDGATVHVALEATKDDVRIHFDDDGPGIDAAHTPHVFDEIKNRAHRPRRGAGRGLPIARAYAEAQNGSIELSTREPHGCRATLVLRPA